MPIKADCLAIVSVCQSLARPAVMNVTEIMTQPVITVTPESLVVEAARLMLQHRVSGLPVIDADGEILGIVTEGDLLRRAETGAEHRRHWLEFLIAPDRFADDYARARGRKVGEVMSEDLVSVGPDDPIEDVVRLMERRHIKRLPVVTAGRLVGIVSRADVVRALTRKLQQPAKTAATDAEIRNGLQAEIAKQPWGPRPSVEVRVANGTVELLGSIEDERERTALRVLAENIPGVKAVRDHLVWLDRISRGPG
jgi:CBS domain-containing protein